MLCLSSTAFQSDDDDDDESDAGKDSGEGGDSELGVEISGEDVSEELSPEQRSHVHVQALPD